MALSTISGQFFGLPSGTLQNLLNTYIQALTDIALSGQSHAITGRQFTQANLSEIRQTIAELQAALNQANGGRIRKTYGNGGGIRR